MGDYIFLGILQGVFEWVPLSSEGIIALTSKFLITPANPIDVALFLHLGTLLAVLFYFRKDWKDLLRFKNSELPRFFLVSTIISLIVGFSLYQGVKNVVIGGGLLMLMGFGLLLTAYFHKKKRECGIELDKLAIITGFLQGMAVIPGLSRSGSTIFGLSLSNFEPEKILKISYMMSVPVVLSSSIYLFIQNPLLVYDSWPALISSFITGLLSLHFLINACQKIDFFKFALGFSLLCFLGAIISFMV